MSYFSHQSMYHPSSSSSSVQNIPTFAPQNYHQIHNPQIPPHFQTIPSTESSSIIPPQFNPHHHAINPYYDSGVYQPNYPGFGAQQQQQQPPPISNYSSNNGASSTWVVPPITNYSSNNGASSTWVVAQAPPIKYSTAIQPVRTEAIALSYEAPSPNYNLIGQMEPNRPMATGVKLPMSQSVRCELCNIECNTVQIYEKHLAGKKHEKSLSKLYAPALQSAALQMSQSRIGPSEVVAPGMPGVPSQPVYLEVKNQGQTSFTCKLCNVLTTGETAYADHLAGKKHIAKERGLGSVMNPAAVITNAQHTTTMKRKIEEPAPAWCDVCKISCTSSDDLNSHVAGKKHKKNVQKLMTPASVAAPAVDPSKGVEPNTSAATSSIPNTPQPKKKVVAEDFETRKQNILDNGAAAANLRTCTLCNVVCNSEKVFKWHLSGQRHASMEMQARAASASHGHASMVPQANAASANTGLRFAYPSA